MMTESEAREYRTMHDAEVRRLSRMTRKSLVIEDRSELASRGIERLYGGPGNKDEFIREILGYRYPVDKLNESIHVLYHKPGETWEACEHCHKKTGE